MSSLLTINPLEIVNQVVTLVVVSVILVFMVKHWNRVMVALTGDDRLHATPMDCVFFTFFRCFGTCTGDWTRTLTKCCCIKRFRGRNVIDIVGRIVGVSTYTVELKNIVVGDLPFNSRADFFIQVECNANPPIVTSLAEEQLPKVVHFPEVITLRLRWNVLDPNVEITVRELNVFGATTLCSCSIAARHLIDWAGNPRDRIKRFEMKPHDRSVERETPAWILLEMSTPNDDRDLDNFYAGTSTVRTTTRDGGPCKDRSIATFKNDYALLDPSGHVMQEPLEEHLQGIECLETCIRRCSRTIFFWGLLALSAPTVCQVWLHDCFRRYKWITIARLSYPNQTAFAYPVLKQMAQECHLALDGTSIPVGHSPCRPRPDQIEATCAGPNGTAFPSEQPPVGAFPHFFQVVTGDEAFLVCPQEVCDLILYHGEQTLWGTGLAWIVWASVLFLLRWAGWRCLESKRKHMQQTQYKITAAVRETMTRR